MNTAVLEAVHPVRLSPRLALAPAALTGAVAPLKTQCSTCHLRELCLPCGLHKTDVERLDRLMFGRRRVKLGQTLFSEGDRFQFVYAIRMGSFKSGLMLADGREQISGFFMAGEMMGLDGIAQGRHASSATALENSEICAIPYAHLSELSSASADLQQVIGRLMSREIVREHNLMLLLGSMNAEERLAAFLLNLSQRFKARGYSACDFNLRMSREEIGSYLGMKLETVSRTFSAFQKQGLLEVDKRHIRIIDLIRLNRALDTRVH